MEIPRVEEELCYDRFYSDYIVANKPCILSAKFTTNWLARKLWVKDNDINFEYLSAIYGNAEVPVADCKGRYYDAQPKTTFIFKEYLEYMQNYQARGYTADMPCLYLKDWHFFKAYPSAEIYEVPSYFTSDWLNEYYLENKDDDYRFVYIGPKDSWTPFHADVFRSFSWSANICGRKKWLLVPPGHESRWLENGNKLAFDITLSQKDKNWIEVIQEAGEIMFVPSNWHHQVYNLEDTISINHNWFNAANISHITAALRTAHLEVLNELGDLVQQEDDESQSHTELVLRCHHGINWHDYANLLYFISTKRVKDSIQTARQLKCHTCNNNPASLCNPVLHADFDLKAIAEEIRSFPKLDFKVSQLKSFLDNL